MSIDPRLAERRKTVAEDNAQRNIGRLLRFLLVAVTLGAPIWLALSPFLSVSQVRTAGIGSSNAHATLVFNRVVAGTPMILIRPDAVETALESDPWVSQARVHLNWPDEVIVRVTERVPVLWVESADAWTWRATDGVAVPGPEFPDASSPQLILDTIPERDLADSQLVKGAAEFVDALGPDVAAGMRITLEEGELWTRVDDFEVRLGRPVDMSAKALSLTALLREDLPSGARLILVAPTHPAVEIDDGPLHAVTGSNRGELETADGEGSGNEENEDGKP